MIVHRPNIWTWAIAGAVVLPLSINIGGGLGTFFSVITR